MAYIPRGKPDAVENPPAAKAYSEKLKDASRLARLCMVMAFVTVMAVGFAVYALAASAHRYAVIDGSTVQAVVAARDVEPGEALDESAVVLAEVPAALATSGAVAETGSVVGRTALAHLPSGSIVDASNLSGASSGGLAGRIADGKLALSVSVTQQTGVSGLVRQGDRVTLFGNVGAGAVDIAKGAEVLAADASLDGAAKDYTALTVAVTLREAQTIAQALEVGQVTFALEPAAPQS